jgi:hypothetical protein
MSRYRSAYVGEFQVAIGLAGFMGGWPELKTAWLNLKSGQFCTDTERGLV